MNQFCEMKSIMRQFSVARTPQQNRVAERRNKTLIEAARTMLASSKTPALSFRRPFGCHVTILNTIDHLGKFDGKADEGFFVGYSLNSKAFRVFNSRTRIVEENLHITFSENTPNVVGSGPNWLFDIDALIRIMNYEPIVAGTQSNSFAGTKASDNACQARKETEHVKDYILLPLWTADPPFSQDPKSSQDDGFKPSSDDGKKVAEDPSKENKCKDQEKEDNFNSTNNVNTVSSTVNVVGTNEDNELLFDLKMPDLEDVSTFNFSSDDEDDGTMADMNNLGTIIQVSPVLTTRIHKDHPLDQVIRDLQSAIHTRQILKNLEEHGFVSTIQQRTNRKNLQNCLFACFLSQEEPRKLIHTLKDPSWIEAMYEELRQFKLQEVWTLVDLPNRKRAIVYVDDIIFGSTRKELCNAFERLMHEKFQMSSIGELTFFLGLQVKQKKHVIFISQDKCVAEILKKFRFTEVKNASTTMETQNPLLKDEGGEEVDVHMYRSMIGSLMYLTSSRPDIMFAVCACARYQVNPKVSHLRVIKRIFRYLKGQLKLCLWYPKDSSFDLVAYTDSDYAGAMVANSITKAEYVAASSCCGQVLWIQLQLLDYGVDSNKIIISEASIRRDLEFADEEGVDWMSNHERKYISPSHTKKFFGNMRRIRKGFSGRIIPLFPTMVVQSQLDEGSAMPTDPHHTPIILQSSTSQLQNTHKPKKPTRKVTEVPQPSEPMENVADETVYKELDDSLVRADTTASSLEAESKTVSLTARVQFSDNEESLGEDASKQGRIEAIDADEDITLVNVQADAKMFDVDKDLGGEEVFVKQEVVADKEKIDEVTLAQALAELKTSKHKHKKKDQIRLDEEAALKLQSEFDEEQRLARERTEKELEANIALIETWDDVQAKIDVDYQLAKRLQAEEQQELTDEEKATLFMQLLEKRKKFFAAKSAEDKNNKPLTQAQQRKIMCTYLKNVEGKKLKDLKNKSFDSIQKMFDRAFKRVNTFVDFRTELVEDKEEVAIDAIRLAVKEDLEDLYRLVKAKFRSTRLVEDLDLLLWGDLKTMFKPHIEDALWRKQQGYKVLEWKLYDSCGVHSLRMQSMHIYMLV
nr:hypothetical protein [Tanacetum cinerariifolium]GEX00880.1 hypothetical protein [Tanacetum cinerariifolium]